MPSKSYLALFLLLLLFIFGAFFAVKKNNTNRSVVVDSYDTCVFAGFPIQESFPRRCTDGSGNNYTEEVLPEKSKANTSVHVFYPIPYTRVGTPISFSGEATADWFLNNSFFVELRTPSGKVIAKSRVVTTQKLLVDKFNYFDDILAIPQSVGDGEFFLVFINGADTSEVIIPIVFDQQ